MLFDNSLLKQAFSQRKKKKHTHKKNNNTTTPKLQYLSFGFVCTSFLVCTRRTLAPLLHTLRSSHHEALKTHVYPFTPTPHPCQFFRLFPHLFHTTQQGSGSRTTPRMAILPRRPTLVAIFCFYIILSLLIVLIVFASSNGKSEVQKVEDGMSVPTTCGVIPLTMNSDKNTAGKCRASVGVQYTPIGVSVRKTAVAYSGIKASVYGDCTGADVFIGRFTFPTLQEQQCWYDDVNTDNVRLWSSTDARGAVPASSDDTTAAITVVLVMLVVSFVFIMLYVAFKCGIFGDRFYGRKGFHPLPNEPSSAHSPRALEAPLMGASSPYAQHAPGGLGGPGAVPAPAAGAAAYNYSPVMHAANPEPMVKVPGGQAQLPASLASAMAQPSPARGYAGYEPPPSLPPPHMHSYSHPHPHPQQQAPSFQYASPHPFDDI